MADPIEVRRARARRNAPRTLRRIWGSPRKSETSAYRRARRTRWDLRHLRSELTGGAVDTRVCERARPHDQERESGDGGDSLRDSNLDPTLSPS